MQDEVVAARPDIDARVEQLVTKGRWQVPGYKEVSNIRYIHYIERQGLGILRILTSRAEIRRPFHHLECYRGVWALAGRALL